MPDEPSVSFAELLRHLRNQLDLTQEELASKAGISTRSVSDLERGINLTARRDTARMLAEALELSGQARVRFEAAARGRAAGEAREPGPEGLPGSRLPGWATALPWGAAGVLRGHVRRVHPLIVAYPDDRYRRGHEPNPQVAADRAHFRGRSGRAGAAVQLG